MNTTDFLSIATAICPDREFMLFDEKKMTFLQTSDRVNRFANSLLESGIKKGDRIGILQVNCSQYIEAYFAAARIGAIFVPLNFRAKTDELVYMISHAEAKILLAGQRYLDMVSRMLPQLPSVKQCICLDSRDDDAYAYYQDLIDSSSADERMAEIGDDDVTILMYTAGTTGRPKGVPLTHNGFVSYVLENVEPANPDVAERNLLTVPLYHVAGIQAMMAATYGGRTMVLMKQFEVREWLETASKKRASRAMLVPTMLKWIVEHEDFSKYDLTGMQVITYGAAPMPYEVIKKAIEKMPWVRFINAFGQTETASTITALGPEDHIIEGTDEEKEKKLKRLTASIGKPLPGVEIKVVDESGNVLAPLEVGEIMARGARIMKGYWKDEEKTSQVITEDGWLRTSDQGWIDDEGYIYMAGRADDMIIRGGENISPDEVEDALYSHPGIEEAAVIGISDPEWGQQPCGVVVLKKGAEATEGEIMEYCRSKLASFKRPQSIIFVDSLPRNQMGKVLRKKLREEYGKL